MMRTCAIWDRRRSVLITFCGLGLVRHLAVLVTCYVYVTRGQLSFVPSAILNVYAAASVKCQLTAFRLAE